MVDVFVEIEGFDEYFINELGEVLSLKGWTRKILKPGVGSNGYFTVSLAKNKKQYTQLVHRLLGNTFIENPDELKCIDHIDRNKLNNNLDNLRWVSYTTNNKNMSISEKNTSGFQGVQFIKKYQLWRAQWHDNSKKPRTKSFSIKKYGDQAKQLAIDYRAKMVDELYQRV